MPNYLEAQIKMVNATFSNNKEEVPIVPQVYDSLHNIIFPKELNKDLAWNNNEFSEGELRRMVLEFLSPFIGQQIYFYPETEEFKQLFRNSFGFSPGNSATKHLGKTYTIVDIPQIDISSRAGTKYVKYIYLRLVDEKGKKIKTKNAVDGVLKTWLSDYDPNLHNSILCVGFYEKLRQSMIGNWYMAKEDGPVARPGNAYSSVQWGHAYQCVDVAVVQNGSFYELDLILQDKNGNSIKTEAIPSNLSLLQEETAYYDSIRVIQEAAEKRALEERIRREKIRLAKEEAARQKAINDSIQRVNDSIQLVEHNKFIIKKYGKYYGKLIIEGKVVLGMTKAMCEEAWGKPKDINVSIGSWGRHEQWVYDGYNYLYFENGKLTSIQN